MKSELSNISDVCSDLASKVSPTGTWGEFKTPQSLSLERSGYVGLEDIDSVSVQFEAKRIADDDAPTKFPKVSYILRLVAVKELVHEELPSMARATIEKAEVAVSTSTLIIATESMLEDQENVEELDDEDDDQYVHERFVQYILDRNGEITEYTDGQGYLVNGEEMTQVSYVYHKGESLKYGAVVREDRVVDQHFSITEEGVSLDEVPLSLPEIHPVSDMRSDLLFIDFLAEHTSEVVVAGQSVEEHRQRIMAMVSFVTLKTNAKELIQTAFA